MFINFLVEKIQKKNIEVEENKKKEEKKLDLLIKNEEIRLMNIARS